MKLIEPKILKGTRDFGPEEMAKRLFVMDKMRAVFENNGYQPLVTPAIEYAETILGKYGDEGDQLTYTFEDKGGRKIALRYDQTVPTARFVAANWSSLAFPFKRYQIGPVWRADKPQKGRYREFVQCDIDIIGPDSRLADAELAKIMSEVFTMLGIKDFVIRVNSRKLLDAILDLCKIDKKDRLAVIRLLDKLDKVSLAKVKKELSQFLNKDQISALQKYILDEKVRGDLKPLPNSPAAEEMKEMFGYFKSMKVKGAQLDLTLARGLDYYTGVIYEVIIPGFKVGSICGGGRYDDLTGLFTDKKFPGTGVAFGLDRIMLWLEENGKLKDVGTSSQVLVANFPGSTKENLKVLAELQKAGVKTEIYADDAKLQKQFKYADKKSIPWMILQGEEEIKKKKVMLKNMKTGKQESITLKKVLEKVK